MTIEKILTHGDRTRWLKLRERDVTASVMGQLLGIDPYPENTPRELWEVKTGRKKESVEQNAAMERGELLEDDALEVLARRHPEWRITHNAGPEQFYLRDPEARIGATLDATAVDPARPGFGVVQVKTADPMSLRQKWLNPETREIDLPLWIAVQVIVEAHLSGASWAMVALLVADRGLDLYEVEVPIHPGVIDRVRREVAEFWRRVAEDDPPPFDYGRDGALIDAIYSEPNGEVDLTTDNMIPGLIAERAELKATIKEAEFRVDEIDAEIKSKLAGAEVGHLPGGKKITWKQQSRRAYSVEAKTFRVLRVPTEI